MKKIMFNDRYGLTDAVLQGRKTMTRRVMTNKVAIAHCEKGYTGCAFVYAHYHVGDVVAIAQSYKDCVAQASERFDLRKNLEKGLKDKAGWENKMFVSARIMPHHIRITRVDIERLQDITDEDSLKEGIIEVNCEGSSLYAYDTNERKRDLFPYAFYAFGALIDKVSGKGTMDSNPWVFVYEFELID